MALEFIDDEECVDPEGETWVLMQLLEALFDGLLEPGKVIRVVLKFDEAGYGLHPDLVHLVFKQLSDKRLYMLLELLLVHVFRQAGNELDGR